MTACLSLSKTATRSCGRSCSAMAISTRHGSCRSCIMTARRSLPASSSRRSPTCSPSSRSRRSKTRYREVQRVTPPPLPCPVSGRMAGADTNEICMTYITKPRLHHPKLPTNALGFTRRDYEGAVSTLCAGCGHDSISAAIIQACFELDLEPHKIAKLSGIGCSSKTPFYFLGKSHGFNSVHGRMPSVLTGANLANRELLYLGISGDGDSASIGLGQFAHCIRRAVNMVYIVENNGVYGLTKGQFSATADQGSKAWSGAVNTDSPIDLVALALQLGASFVARSFSGDKAQLVPLIKA